MNIQLIKGAYPQNEALELVLKMINVKISYHEQKISRLDNEEDMKMRERRIMELQNEAARIRAQFGASTDASIKLNASIQLI